MRPGLAERGAERIAQRAYEIAMWRDYRFRRSEIKDPVLRVLWEIDYLAKRAARTIKKQTTEKII